MYTSPLMQNDQTYDRERKNLTENEEEGTIGEAEAEEEVIKDEDDNDNDDGTSWSSRR
ncbi:MAG: hypothetical protein WCF07_14185 [Nitrososphaeraceae archaeon]